ncbi:hypothetical protein GOP47_0023697 [Adiantum capillus-veneris]|uniref:Protein kinase domain-containing protein n=1 Tax=Adiantum capillus-veneris TaxID=13818 RepID=A0A9D4Z5D4_ADICA|nr:hypothetical protein GOP47_0023697 [Adiantum capillus-veneris]
MPNMMKRLPSAADGATPPKRHATRFAPILPFRTPSDLAALYELGPELGRGQFGIIRRCANRTSGTLFACKSISKLLLRTIHDIKDVVSEINIMRHLSNHMDGASATTSGGELFDRIVKKKCYPEAQAACLMKSLLETLQFCHNMGIMHRDVKPENILFVDDSDESDIKLADFGLALEFSPGQKFSGMAGSAYYMAPEVLCGEYSEEVDMWSAGVILYVLLSGVPPFWGHTEEGIFTAIQEGQLDLTSEPWQKISASAKDLIVQMLCVDVKLRCTPAQALEHPWIVSNTLKAVELLPPLIIDQSPDIRSYQDLDLSADEPTSLSDDRPIHREHDNTENLGIVTAALLVNLKDTTVIDPAETNCSNPELGKLMVALVAALDIKRLSLSESLSKVRLQAGWTCTLLATSAIEETLLVDMGLEKYLIAHDRLRKRIGWKVMRPQCFRRMHEKITSARPPWQKLQQAC